MKRGTLLLVAVAVGAAAAGNPPAAPLRLGQILRAAVSNAKIQEARLDLAQNTLKFLETQNRIRIELRPSLNMFAFSNPALLATNIGTGLLFNRRTAPGFAAMDSARFDAVAAQVNAETAKVRVQLEAAAGYFDLLEKQQVARLASGILATRRIGGAEVTRLLEASRITIADRLAYEQELVDLEWQYVSAESDRKTAAARLAAMIGMDEQVSTLSVEDVEVRAVDEADALAPVDRLINLALTYRNESRLMRDRISALQGKRTTGRRPAVESIGAGYAYVNNNTGVSNALTGSILGGNTARGDVTLNIPLKSNGERAAHDSVTAARIQLLELEISAMEDSVRAQVTALREAAASHLELLRLAARKLDIALKNAEIVRARAENGLTSLNSAWAAEQAVVVAQSAYARAEYGRKSSVYALRVVCGIDGQDAEGRERNSPGE